MGLAVLTRLTGVPGDRTRRATDAGPPPRLVGAVAGLAIVALAMSVVGLLPAVMPAAQAATTPISQGKPATCSSLESAAYPCAERGRWQHRHPLVVGVQ